MVDKIKKAHLKSVEIKKNEYLYDQGKYALQYAWVHYKNNGNHHPTLKQSSANL